MTKLQDAVNKAFVSGEFTILNNGEIRFKFKIKDKPGFYTQSAEQINNTKNKRYSYDDFVFRDTLRKLQNKLSQEAKLQLQIDSFVQDDDDYDYYILKFNTVNVPTQTEKKKKSGLFSGFKSSKSKQTFAPQSQSTEDIINNSIQNYTNPYLSFSLPEDDLLDNKLQLRVHKDKLPIIARLVNTQVPKLLCSRNDIKQRIIADSNTEQLSGSSSDEENALEPELNQLANDSQENTQPPTLGLFRKHSPRNTIFSLDNIEAFLAPGNVSLNIGQSPAEQEQKTDLSRSDQKAAQAALDPTEKEELRGLPQETVTTEQHPDSSRSVQETVKTVSEPTDKTERNRQAPETEREQQAKEQAEREQQAKEQAEREQQAKEQAEREQQAKEQAEREQQAKEQAEQEAEEKARQEAEEKARQEAKEKARQEAKEIDGFINPIGKDEFNRRKAAFQTKYGPVAGRIKKEINKKQKEAQKEVPPELEPNHDQNRDLTGDEALYLNHIDDGLFDGTTEKQIVNLDALDNYLTDIETFRETAWDDFVSRESKQVTNVTKELHSMLEQKTDLISNADVQALNDIKEKITAATERANKIKHDFEETLKTITVLQNDIKKINPNDIQLELTKLENGTHQQLQNYFTRTFNQQINSLNAYVNELTKTITDADINLTKLEADIEVLLRDKKPEHISTKINEDGSTEVSKLDENETIKQTSSTGIKYSQSINNCTLKTKNADFTHNPETGLSKYAMTAVEMLYQQYDERGIYGDYPVEVYDQETIQIICAAAQAMGIPNDNLHFWAKVKDMNQIPKIYRYQDKGLDWAAMPGIEINQIYESMSEHNDKGTNTLPLTNKDNKMGKGITTSAELYTRIKAHAEFIKANQHRKIMGGLKEQRKYDRPGAFGTELNNIGFFKNNAQVKRYKNVDDLAKTGENEIKESLRPKVRA